MKTICTHTYPAAPTCSRSSIVDFIRRYNRWRRGDESLTMESPKAIGDALDAVCDTLDEHANEIQGWQNKWECAVEMAARAELERDELRTALIRLHDAVTNRMTADEPTGYAIPADWICDCKDSAIRRVDEDHPHPASKREGWFCMGCLQEFIQQNA